MIKITNSAPRIEITKHPQYRVIHSNGIFGGLSPVEGSIAFYTDMLEPKMMNVENQSNTMQLDKINREMQIEVRMSINDFVALAEWMNNHIKRFEELGIMKKDNVIQKKKLDYGV